MKILEADGIIKGHAILLDAALLDLEVSAICSIKQHDEATLLAFEHKVLTLPDMVQRYSMAGGIQEFSGYTEATHEMFPCAWSYDRGYLQPGEAPGHGVDIDEKVAARHPYSPAYLPVARLEDGTLTSW